VGSLSRCPPISPNPISPNIYGYSFRVTVCLGLGIGLGIGLGSGLGELGLGEMGQNH